MSSDIAARLSTALADRYGIERELGSRVAIDCFPNAWGTDFSRMAVGSPTSNESGRYEI